MAHTGKHTIKINLLVITITVGWKDEKEIKQSSCC